MILKEMRELGIERKKELGEYLDFSDFDKFMEILNKKFTGVYVNQNSIENLMSIFLFSTNIKGAISSKYGLNGLVASKVDSDTKEDFVKIQEIIDHIDKAKGLIKTLKSSPSNQFVTYTQFGIGHNQLNSHLEEVSSSFKTALRLTKGKADNKKTYYSALKQASEYYAPPYSSYKMTSKQCWELFRLEAVYCVFLIQKKLLKKSYGTFKNEFWDVENGLNRSLEIIEPEFISCLERR